MHSHLMNCHGEWTILFLIFGHATVIAVWLRSLLSRSSVDEEK